MMRKIIRPSVAVGVALVLVCGTMITNAQQRGNRQRGDQQGQRQGRQGAGQFDPAQMRQMMMERYKEALNATDEEWKAIGPLVENVIEKQREARGIGFGGRGMMGFGGRGVGGPDMQRSGGRGGGGASPEVTALQQALDSESTPATEIKSKLEAFRKARDTREKDLQNAREELRQVLTVRQEATLVLMGLLD